MLGKWGRNWNTSSVKRTRKELRSLIGLRSQGIRYSRALHPIIVKERKKERGEEEKRGEGGNAEEPKNVINA